MLIKKENLLGCLVTEKMDGRLLGFWAMKGLLSWNFEQASKLNGCYA